MRFNVSVMRLSAAAALLVCFSPQLTASPTLAGVQSNASNLVVTANRLEQDRLRVGSTVYVVTAEEIEKRQYQDVNDVLRTIPGVRVARNGPLGGAATIRLRGAATEQTLVLVDGIPVNDPASIGGAYNFAFLNTADIERIEVLTGPQSTLYGSDAMAGVINIITHSAAGQAPLQAYAEYGSFDTARAGAQFARAGKSFSGRFSADIVDTDGISKADENNGNTERDAFDSLTLSGQGTWQLSEDFSLTTTGRYSDSETEYDNGFGIVDGDFVNDNKEYWGGLTADFTAFERLQNKLSLHYSRIERADAGADNAFPSAFDGERTVLAYQGDWEFSPDNRLLFGGEYEETRLEQPLISDADEELDSVGAYLMYQFAPTDAFDVTLGLRNDRYDSDSGYQSDKSETTGRATVAWNIPDTRSTLRASWGQGFKAPSLFQLTYTEDPVNYPPNPDLRPQTNQGWELGYEYRGAGPAKVYTQLTWFYDETKDQIDYVYNPGIGLFGAGRYENIDRVRRKGFEIVFGGQLTEALAFRLSASHADAEDRATGEQLSRVPEYSATADLSWQVTETLSAFAVLFAQDRQDDSPFNTVETPGFAVLNVGGDYALSEQLTVYARIENLLDREYQEVFGFGTPDRSFYLGLRATLGR